MTSADLFENSTISEDQDFTTAAQDTTPPQISQIQALVITDTTLASSHQFTLQGLAPATTYHLQAWSADVLGNWSVSPDTTLVTKHLLPKQPGKPSHYDD